MAKTTKIPANAFFDASYWMCSPRELQTAISDYVKEHNSFEPDSFLQTFFHLVRGEPSYDLKVNLCKIVQVRSLCSKCELANTDDCNLLIPYVAKERTSNGKLLVSLTEGLVETFNFKRKGFTWVKIGNRQQVLPIESKTFLQWLSWVFYNTQQTPVSKDAIADAQRVFLSRALFESPSYDLFNRVAEYDGNIWFDMSNDAGEAVRIGPDGWEIVGQTPIPLFNSYDHQRPAYRAIKHESIEPFELRNRLERIFEFINIPEQNQSLRLLCMAHLVSFFIPEIPRPGFFFHGVHGSAKTTAGRAIKHLVDPSELLTQSMQRKQENLIQSLDHHHLLLLDNLTKIYDGQSDLFCGAITGTGIQVRQLYTDDDVYIRSFKRCLIFTGINIAAENPDLLDRLVLYELERLDPGTTREETLLWSLFDRYAPEILGTIFDILSHAMRIKHDIQTTGLPRMADWTKWCCAITQSLGIYDNDFLQAYEKNRQSMTVEALLNDKVGIVLLHLLERIKEWSGIASDLLSVLADEAKQANVSIEKDWPADPPRLGKKLRELEPNLIDFGISVERHSKRTERTLTFTYGRKASSIKSTDKKKGLELYIDSDATEGIQYSVEAKSPVDGSEGISDSSDSSDSKTHKVLSPRPKPVRESRGIRAYEKRWQTFLKRTSHFDTKHIITMLELDKLYSDKERAQMQRDLEDWTKDGRLWINQSKSKRGWRVTERGNPTEG